MMRASVLVGVSIVFVSGVLASPCRADLNEGLVAHYAFNGNVEDSSGGGNDGTIFGGEAYTKDHWGNPNGALHFDGVDDYVLLPNEGNFSLTEFSIVVTAKVPNYDQVNYLIQKGLLGGNYSVSILDWGFPYYSHQGASGEASAFIGSSGVPKGTYFQLAVTYSAEALSRYVDGSVPPWLSNPVGIDAPLLNDEPVTIGASGYDASSDFFLGDIDEVRIYNRVLTASEVAELNVQVNPVPLPGAVLLGTIGLSYAGYRLRRRTD